MYEQDHSNGDDETKKLAEIGTITKKMNKICDSDYTENGNPYNSDAYSVMFWRSYHPWGDSRSGQRS